MRLDRTKSALIFELVISAQISILKTGSDGLLNQRSKVEGVDVTDIVQEFDAAV